ncbi:hypothetical protein DFH09DRAFT_1475382 [Mycena vulgaris]|nr:hypothetical protein DFH09DRAFT_1475382 [Mycena vulgaris]
MIVVVERSSVRVSRHQNRPILWKMVPHPEMRSAWEFSLANLISDAFFPIPTALAYLFCGVFNPGVALALLARRVFEPRWTQEQRIAEDLGRLYGRWMRVQSLFTDTPDRFTLVAFSSPLYTPLKDLTIPRLPALTDAQRAALLTALDLGRSLITLTIAEGANCALVDVMDFGHRHPTMTRLALEPHSLLPGSLVDIVHIVPAVPGRITDLTAPASYIPHLLPAESNVERIHITFAAASSFHNSPAFDIPACIRALDAIAILPDPPSSRAHCLGTLNRRGSSYRSSVWRALSLITDGVSITPPFERPQGSAASARWGGIVSDQTGMDISWGEYRPPGFVLREVSKNYACVQLQFAIRDSIMLETYAKIFVAARAATPSGYWLILTRAKTEPGRRHVSLYAMRDGRMVSHPRRQSLWSGERQALPAFSMYISGYPSSASQADWQGTLPVPLRLRRPAPLQARAPLGDLAIRVNVLMATLSELGGREDRKASSVSSLRHRWASGRERAGSTAASTMVVIGRERNF